MNFSASRLSAPALLAVLFMLPTALHAARQMLSFFMFDSFELELACHT